MGLIVEELALNFPKSTARDLTYYISTNGNNENDGVSIDTPFNTVRKALSSMPLIVDHIVTIYIDNGDYNENIAINNFNGSGSINIVPMNYSSSDISFLSLSVTECSCFVRISNIKITG